MIITMNERGWWEVQSVDTIDINVVVVLRCHFYLQ